MKEDYERQVQKLVKLVDGATDVVDFVRVSGECVEMSRIYLSRNALRWEVRIEGTAQLGIFDLLPRIVYYFRRSEIVLGAVCEIKIWIIFRTFHTYYFIITVVIPVYIYLTYYLGVLYSEHKQEKVMQ